VAQIAEQNLTVRAAEGVRQILGPDRHLADIANISDDVRGQHPETGPWHYVDIPLSATSFNRDRYCSNGNCVVAAIERFRSELQMPGLSPERRYEALYNLVHFVGDLHQPLHSIDNDRGGNDVKVEFLGKETNLHSVWDTGLIADMGATWEALARKLGRVSRSRKSAWSSGTPEEWAMESHGLGREVYRFQRPASGLVLLDKRYERRGQAVVRRQLPKAGVRLAYLLNQSLDPNLARRGSTP
jgi:hypothetical protein